MTHKPSKYPIAPELLSITQQQIMQLDQDSMDGAGWEYYMHGFVSGATVFQDTLIGQVRELTIVNNVEIKVSGPEIYTSCSCSRTGGVCKHAIALLYSWTNDADSFIDVGKSIAEIERLSKERLLSALRRILIHDPKYIAYALGRYPVGGGEIDETLFDEDDFEGTL